MQEGDEIHCRIRIDPERRRVGLSLRQASEESYVEMDWREEARTGLGEEDEAGLANRQLETALGTLQPEVTD